MALRDYSEDDDFYTQGFERPGVLSIWVSAKAVAPNSQTDVLQDLCGVGYYGVDNQEANAHQEQVPLEVLLSEISYSKSFLSNALVTAHKMGINLTCWMVVQFDFFYNPAQVKRPISSDPIFLGVFSYSDA